MIPPCVTTVTFAYAGSIPHGRFLFQTAHNGKQPNTTKS